MNLADVFSNYFEVREELVEAVKDLTSEQLTWQPKDHPNSIGKLLAHIAETECWWIECVALGHYDRPTKAEFEVGPLDCARGDIDDCARGDIDGRFEDKPALRRLLALLDKYRVVTEGYLKAETVEASRVGPSSDPPSSF